MVARLALLMAVLIAVGCSQEKAETQETPASKEAGTVAASEWTEEQKAAFKTAHDRARSGEDK